MFHARTRLIVGVLVILLAGSAVFPRIGVAEQDVSATNTGNDLLRQCSVWKNLDSAAITESNSIEIATSVAYCGGLVYGVWHMTMVMLQLRESKVEFPPEATLDQVIRIVIQYLETHPERLHETNYLLASTALIEAWGD